MPLSKNLRALAALALLTLSAPALAAPARSAPRNLLSNPGFEISLPGHDWMPADWDTSDAGLSTVFFGRDTLLAHGGHWSVNIANTSTVYAMTHNWSQTLFVGREMWGKVAVFSLWTRSSGVEGRAYVLVQAYRDTISRMARIWGVDRDEASRRMMINTVDDPLLDFGWKRLVFEDPQTDWVRREVRTFVAPGTNMLYVRCGLIGTGQVHMDDASLTLEPAPPPPVFAAGHNLLQDPDFEAGGGAWEWAVPPFQGALIDRDSTHAHSGRLSMRASNVRDGLTSTRMGVCQPVSGRGLAGKRVRFSGWLRADSLVSTAYAMIYCHTLHGMVRSPSSVPLSMTFDWTAVSTEMDLPPDTQEIWVWLAFNAPAPGVVWFDDGSFEVVGSAATPAPAARRPAAKPGATRSR